VKRWRTKVLEGVEWASIIMEAKAVALQEEERRYISERVDMQNVLILSIIRSKNNYVTRLP
jgi:hypothetical protein